MDSSNDLTKTNDKAQEHLLSIEQKQASRIINAMFCTKVDQDNAPLKCNKCWSYGANCKGRPTI